MKYIDHHQIGVPLYIVNWYIKRKACNANGAVYKRGAIVCICMRASKGLSLRLDGEKPLISNLFTDQCVSHIIVPV